jgi:hypothetical protein
MTTTDNLKPIKKEIEGAVIKITVEQKLFFGLLKKKIVFSSNSIIVGKYRNWLKEPNKTLVHDYLSFQLDEWNNVME